MIENKIIDYLSLVIEDKYNLNLKDKIKLEKPPKPELWDFSFPCFVLSKDLKKNPNIIAEEISSLIEKNEFIEKVIFDWPYINIKISSSSLEGDKINFINSKIKDFYEGNNKDLKEKNKSKTIYIDYIWANVWKPLHIWHMCTPNQWQVIINTYKRLWYDVISDSHIGDWGIIFGKLITAYKLWWDENKLKENAVEHLFELYVKVTKESESSHKLEDDFRNTFKELSSWDKNSIKLWESFTKESIKSIQTQLNRLNIKSDFNIWESFYEWLNLPKIEKYPDLKYDMKTVVEELIKKWIATRNNDNSVWVEFNRNLKIPSCVLQKRDWTHGYLASDLASIKYRVDNWNLEEIIYFVDVRQQLHLKQAFIIAEHAWWLDKWKDKVKLVHAHNWFISLKDWAMSTRKWKIIKLDKLLDEASERAKKIILEKRTDIKWKELEELSEIIWIWAIKYGYLKKSRETDVIFDWDEFMTFEWNSWPYIQYAYVRANKILKDSLNIEQLEALDSKIKLKDESLLLFKKLLDYNKALIDTSEKYMPHVLCRYLYELTKTFNSFYNNISILNEENYNLKNLNLSLTKKFCEVLKEWFDILWIKMPEKM